MDVAVVVELIGDKDVCSTVEPVTSGAAEDDDGGKVLCGVDVETSAVDSSSGILASAGVVVTAVLSVLSSNVVSDSPVVFCVLL